MVDDRDKFPRKPHLWLIRLAGVIVPRRLRADWRQEWEAELQYREMMLAEWDRIGRRGKFDLLGRSMIALWDALLLQPRRWEDEMFQDLRYGVRMLLKHKAFTLVATLSLALGIGANTAIFSLINAALLKTLPVKDPGQLVVFTTVGPQQDDNSYSYPMVEEFYRNNHSFTDIVTAGNPSRMRMSEPGEGVSMAMTTRVSGNFFSGLGAGAVIGRTLTAEDDSASNPRPVAVISYKFWKDRFGLDPGVIGRKILLDDYPFTVVGVAPPGFFGFEVGFRPDVWWPLQMTPQVTPGNQILRQGGAEWLRVMARLKPGVAIEQARAEMDAVFKNSINRISPENAARFTTQQRRNYFERSIRLDSGTAGFSYLRRMIAQPLFVLMAVVGLVLVIACANVANLLLARAASRRKEIAVRLALGAGRLRLVRQLLTESLLLAASGGALGLLVARWGGNLLLAYLPGQGMITFDLAPDRRMLLFTSAVSLLTGALFGLAPALRATRLDLNSSLKNSVGSAAEGEGPARLSMHKALVVVQVALSLFLLIGAGLFVRSLQNLKSLDAGFDRENLTVFGLDVGRGYTPERFATLQKELLERLESLPGARSASLSHVGLLTGTRITNEVSVEGYAQRPDEDMNCHTLYVGPKYFATMGAPLLRGRDFSPQEMRPKAGLLGDSSTAGQSAQPTSGATTGVIAAAVINQAMARYFFGERNPLGRRFHFRNGPLKDIPLEIIGVARDAKYHDMREQPPRTFYLSFSQWRRGPSSALRILLRAVGDPSGEAAAVRRVTHELDPQIQVVDLKTMNEVVDESLTQERFVAQLGGFFSLCALLLACIGLYGVMSYATTRRAQEIGLRMALGAQGRDIVRMVMRETLFLVVPGLAIGLVASLAATRLVGSLLYGLTATNPLTIALSALLLLAVAAFAGYLPARRASHVDPLTALRYE